VLLAAAVTKVKDGKALVPAINAQGSVMRLPSKRELGTWIPLDDDVEVLELTGELRSDWVQRWLNNLGDGEKPLNNEEVVNVGVSDEGVRPMVLQLLRAYRELTENASDCPPATALGVEHHIDTGDAAPTMLKRRRQAQSEDTVVDGNVTKMLAAGVIEEGNGAWGFPVILVKKKDGEVRFCVDYRALNRITNKDVYPLPRIDETIEALGGALLFSTLDLKAGYWQIRMAEQDKAKTALPRRRVCTSSSGCPLGCVTRPPYFRE
jgi:hypothetical protein